MVWVQLRVIKQIEQHGATMRYHPGDWVEVGKQTAMLWVGAGDAWLPDVSLLTQFADCGVICDEKTTPPALPGTVTVKRGRAELAYSKTLLLNGGVKFRAELLPVGFALLENWQIAAPLFSYDQLAAHVGSEAEREQTKAMIRDLRVPLYDTRVIFVRRCKETRALLELWQSEHAAGGDDKLAFLRAFYQVKPILCALPQTWIKA